MQLLVCFLTAKYAGFRFAGSRLKAARNDDTRCRHCEERNNPEKAAYKSVAKTYHW